MQFAVIALALGGGVRRLSVVRAPPTFSVNTECRPCYCEYYTQDCAGDGKRCVGEERILRGRVRVEGYSEETFNYQLCGYNANSSAASCNCPCRNTANLLMETRPLPSEPRSTSCPICTAASLLMEEMPGATQMGKWLTWRNTRIKSAAEVRGNAMDGWVLESDVYVHTQSRASACVAAEWLELQRQLDVHFGRASNYSKLRNNSKADAVAWMEAFGASAKRAQNDNFNTYKPATTDTDPGLDVLDFKLAIIEPMVNVHVALPCTRETHLYCNGVAAGAVPTPTLAALSVVIALALSAAGSRGIVHLA